MKRNELPVSLPTLRAPEGFKYGWFSNEQAKVNGTIIYKLTNYNEVETTVVSSEPKHNCAFDDMVYVGLVFEKGSRRGREGSFRPVR